MTTANGFGSGTFFMGDGNFVLQIHIDRGIDETYMQGFGWLLFCYKELLHVRHGCSSDGQFRTVTLRNRLWLQYVHDG